MRDNRGLEKGGKKGMDMRTNEKWSESVGIVRDIEYIGFIHRLGMIQS